MTNQQEVIKKVTDNDIKSEQENYITFTAKEKKLHELLIKRDETEQL